MSTLVLGAGVSGLGVARMLHRLGRPFEVYDEHASGELDGVEIESGEWDPAYLIGIDRVVASPGFPETSQPILDALAQGIPVRSELDLAASLLTATFVAVTGTNGKTTTTELIDAMLRRSGVNSIAAGNIGTALSDLVDAGDAHDVVVIEASSFQLRFAETLAPDVAVVLNVEADHLDWHGSVEAYASAKARIVEHQGPEHLVIHNADDENATAIAEASAGRRIGVSGSSLPEGGAGRDGDELVVGPIRIPLDALQVTDAAYLLDLAAAGVAAMEAGATPEGVEATIRAFHPGRHRRQTVLEVGGIRWVDDSKATNPHAAVAAIAGYPNVVLIAGGRNKGLDLTPIVAMPQLRTVLAIGEAAGDFVALDGALVTDVGTVRSAVERAAEIAVPGDTVLLAPGCASFDQFPSYAARGDAFAAAVVDVVVGEEAAV